MNVGSEAFGFGFLLPGVTGNFTAAGTAPGNPEADLLMGISGGAIHDQHTTVQSRAAAGRS